MGLVLPEFDFKPTTSKVKGSLCVPVILDTRGVYNIYVAKNNIRLYNSDSLPSYVKIKIIIADELRTNPKFKSIYSIPQRTNSLLVQKMVMKIFHGSYLIQYML